MSRSFSCLRSARESLGCLRRVGDSVLTSYVRICTKWPGTCLVILPVLVLGFIVAGFALAGVPDIETDVTSGAYLRTDGIITDRYDNLLAAEEHERERRSGGGLRRLSSGTLDGVFEDAEEATEEGRRLLSTQTWAKWKVDLYFYSPSGSIFDEHVLNNIRAFEEELTELPSYSKYCYKEPGRRNCREFISSMRFFHGSTVSTDSPRDERRRVKHWEPNVAYYIFPDSSNPYRSTEGAVLNAMLQNYSWPGSYSPRLWYFDQHFPHSSRVRSRAWFGLPLDGFEGPWDRSQDQLDKYWEFIHKELHPYLEDKSTRMGGVKVYWEGPELTDYEVLKVVGEDARLAFISLFFVWSFMAIYTKAPLLAALGMTVVVLSVPMGVVLFSFCGFHSFPVLNFLAFFLIIGIGADHLFVLVDAWRQTASETADLETRFRLTLSRAGKAITACSLTTAASFLSNLFSSVRPLRWFGVFVGFCVLSNYVLCVTMFPLILVYREKGKAGWCCRRKPLTAAQAGRDGAASPPSTPAATTSPLAMKRTSSTNSEASNLNLLNNAAGTSSTSSRIFVRSPSSAQADDSSNLLRSAANPDEAGQPAAMPRPPPRDPRYMELFFKQTYGPALARCPLCLVLIGAVLTVSSFLTVLFVLEISDTPPEFFARGTHNLADAPLQKDHFGRSPWVQEMEQEPLRVCQGCQWEEGQSGITPHSCQAFGFSCERLACESIADCHYHGFCGQDGRCHCTEGRTGDDCSLPSGDQNCGASEAEEACSGHGVCEDNTCRCHSGWAGAACEVFTDGASIDCQWGDWGAWSRCNSECGWGHTFRFRPIVVEAKYGGKRCSGISTDRSSCLLKECDVDCMWLEWEDWTPCSAHCAYGMTSRSRFFLSAQGNGKPCEGEGTMRKACELKPCPPSCEYTEWRERQPCSATCGDAMRLEERSLLNTTLSHSPDCDAEQVREVQCNLEECVDECNHTFGEWVDAADGGNCSVTCGEGVKLQVREVFGSECPGACCLAEGSELRRRQVPCSRVELCPTECSDTAYDAWTEWTACSASCGKGTKERSRSGGPMCIPKTETQTCEIVPCQQICDQYQWEAAGTCSVTCGHGEQPEARRVPEMHLDLCQTTRMVPCELEACPVNCVLGDWVVADPCSVTCGYGRQRHTRHVVQREAFGGQPCPMDAELERFEVCHAAAPCPGVVFAVRLHGSSFSGGSMSGENAEVVRIHLARLLGVPLQDIKLEVSTSVGRLLSEQEEVPHVELTVSVFGTDGLDLSTLDNQLASSLANQDGFEALQHVEVVIHKNGDNGNGGSNATSTERPWWWQEEPDGSSDKYVQQGEHLPDSRVAKVSIVFGLRSEAPSEGASLGAPVFDPDFDFGWVATQKAVHRTCEAGLREKDKLAVRSVKCVVKEMDEHIQTKEHRGPVVRGPQAHQEMFNFINSPDGFDWEDLVGFTSTEPPKVQWLQVQFVTNLPEDMPAEDAWDWKQEWDAFVARRNHEEAHAATGVIYHTSELWVRAETEIGLINSTFLCLLISVFASFCMVVLMLGNLALTGAVIAGILCIVICLGGLMFGVFGWKLGAVQAVSLIVFVGFSVDYLLHMAESFIQADGRADRKERAIDALRRTGGAITAAAATSILAGIPILWCIIQVFVKIGVTVISNTCISLVFALGFFPAVLMVSGPEKDLTVSGTFGSVLWRWGQAGVPEAVVATGTVVGTGFIGSTSWVAPMDPAGGQSSAAAEDPKGGSSKASATTVAAPSGRSLGKSNFEPEKLGRASES